MNIKEKIGFYAGLMFISGLFGWLYEIIFYFINGGCKEIYLRGVCFLPILDIYVIGGLLIYLLCNKLKKKPILVFITSGTVCGILEYITGFLIYKLLNEYRPWDYNTEILNFGNINGFICLRSVLFFACSGLILIYVIAPILNKILKSKYKKIISIIFIVLFSLFIIDESYNQLAKFNIIKTPSAGDVYRNLGLKYWPK